MMHPWSETVAPVSEIRWTTQPAGGEIGTQCRIHDDGDDNDDGNDNGDKDGAVNKKTDNTAIIPCGQEAAITQQDCEFLQYNKF